MTADERLRRSATPVDMGVSMVGVYHYRGKRLVAYRNPESPSLDRRPDFRDLEAELRAADLVIGFNWPASTCPRSPERWEPGCWSCRPWICCRRCSTRSATGSASTTWLR